MVKVIEQYNTWKNKKEYFNELHKTDVVRQSNVDWALNNFDTEIVTNFPGQWVLVHDQQARAASLDLHTMLNERRARSDIKHGDIIIYGAVFPSFSYAQACSYLILDIDSTMLEGFV